MTPSGLVWLLDSLWMPTATIGPPPLSSTEMSDITYPDAANFDRGFGAHAWPARSRRELGPAGQAPVRLGSVAGSSEDCRPDG